MVDPLGNSRPLGRVVIQPERHCCHDRDPGDDPGGEADEHRELDPCAGDLGDCHADYEESGDSGYERICE